VVAPTHAEGTAITAALRSELRAQGKLKDERIVNTWLSARLTEAQRTDPTEYGAGDMVQFQQNAKGYTKGTRIVVGDGVVPPLEMAKKFELYRCQQLAVAAGDRIRITAGGKTKDGKHRLSTGALLTVERFTKHGDIVVDHGWVIDREFGHFTHGYTATSHASQGRTVDKVIVAISSQSIPATDQRTAYVAVTRGKEQALIFTDSREELMLAVQRGDRAMSATELAELSKPDTGNAPSKRKRSGRAHDFLASWNRPDTPEQVIQQISQELSHDR